MARSFAHPDTHFYLPESEPGDHDGCYPGQPTGEVVCDRCLSSAMDVDEIDHWIVAVVEDGEVRLRECPQADVHSRARCDKR